MSLEDEKKEPSEKARLDFVLLFVFLNRRTGPRLETIDVEHYRKRLICSKHSLLCLEFILNTKKIGVPHIPEHTLAPIKIHACTSYPYEHLQKIELAYHSEIDEITTSVS